MALVFLVCAAGVACLDGGLGLAMAVLRELLRGAAALAAVAAMLAAAAGAALAGEARACARAAGQVLPALPDASQGLEGVPKSGAFPACARLYAGHMMPWRVL